MSKTQHLTMEQRHELVERYKKERIRRVDLTVDKKTILSNEDMLNLPRHQVNCLWFSECPIDYKCRNYDPTYLRCQNCPLHQTDGICHKKAIHTDKNISMMITRERINLDDEDESGE